MLHTITVYLSNGREVTFTEDKGKEPVITIDDDGQLTVWAGYTDLKAFKWGVFPRGGWVGLDSNERGVRNLGQAGFVPAS